MQKYVQTTYIVRAVLTDFAVTVNTASIVNTREPGGIIDVQNDRKSTQKGH